MDAVRSNLSLSLGDVDNEDDEDDVYRRRRKMRKSQTESWSSDNRSVFRPDTEKCGLCSVPDHPGSEENSDATPSPRSSKKYFHILEHSDSCNYRQAANSDDTSTTKGQIVRTCFKHQHAATPTPTPPPPPVSPDVAMLAFSPTCSQHCRKVLQQKPSFSPTFSPNFSQKVLQKKSHHTIWHPRSGATTVSYTKD